MPESKVTNHTPIQPEDLYRYVSKKRFEYPDYIQTDEEKKGWREAMAYVKFALLHRDVSPNPPF